jgi:hypothetical protein
MQIGKKTAILVTGLGCARHSSPPYGCELGVRQD